MSDSDRTIDSDEFNAILGKRQAHVNRQEGPRRKQVRRSSKLHEISGSSDEDDIDERPKCLTSLKAKPLRTSSRQPDRTTTAVPSTTDSLYDSRKRTDNSPKTAQSSPRIKPVSSFSRRSDKMITGISAKDTVLVPTIRNSQRNDRQLTSDAPQKPTSGPLSSAQQPEETVHVVSENATDRKPSNTNLKRDNRPLCKFGTRCYRGNPEHRREYRHDESANEEKPCQDYDGALFGLYFTTVDGIPARYNGSTIARSVTDLLSPDMGDLVRSAQFNYCFDVHWLIDKYPAEFRNLPLLIVHGEQREAKRELEASGAAFPNVTFVQAKLPILYGTHHTKMMLLLYRGGMRVVVHTANMVETDWARKTQGIWTSPLCPKLVSSAATGDSDTNFRADLLQYLGAYGDPKVNEWCHYIRSHDFSAVKVFLVGSVPGRHTGPQKSSFGHLKLRKLLIDYGPSKELVTNYWPVIGQFSSIGSLGSSADAWLRGEFLTSLSTVGNAAGTMGGSVPLKLVFPSVEDVRLSLEGYPAGASLPYSISTAQKQRWLDRYFHRWKSDNLGRSRASPHVKSYVRLSPSGRQASWLLVTSANLSKAAWGALEKSGSQLMIRSYELGVLFLPSCFGVFTFLVCDGASGKSALPLPLPFDVPLVAYGQEDEPWTWDSQHRALPDRFGNMWCPPVKRGSR